MKNADLIKAARESVRNGTPLMTGVVDLLCNALAEADTKLSPALSDIIAERQRQQSAEGWTPEHDDKYQLRELTWAAMSYAGNSISPYAHAPFAWPWQHVWWKPTNPRRDLVKAAALIAAEIERIDREELK